MDIKYANLDILKLQLAGIGGANKLETSVGSTEFWKALLAYSQEASKQGAVAETAAAEETAADAPQTLEELKAEIHDFISSLPIHPSQAQSHISISIHDNVFERMLADPEYKEEVKDMLREQMSTNFVVPPAFVTVRLDAEGEYSGSAGGSAHLGAYERESADSFWQRRADTKKEQQKKVEQDRERKEKLEELLDRLAQNRRLLYRELNGLNQGPGLGNFSAISASTGLTPKSTFGVF